MSNQHTLKPGDQIQHDKTKRVGTVFSRGKEWCIVQFDHLECIRISDVLLIWTGTGAI